jgi:hypothetical protein
MVDGQSEHGQPAAHLFAPVRQVSLQFLALHAFALPPGDVTHLDGRFIQGRLPATRPGGVELLQFASENTHRPAVRDQVMKIQHQDVPVIGEPDDHSPEERPPLQVEGPVGLFVHQPLRLPVRFPGIGFAQVHDLQLQRTVLVHDEVRSPRAGPECRSKGFMAPNDPIQGPFEGRDVNRPLQADGARHVVRRVLGIQLVDEPQSLLSKGQRQFPHVIAAADNLRRPPGADRFFRQHPGQQLLPVCTELQYRSASGGKPWS